MSSKYFPSDYREATKLSVESLENNCNNPYGALIQIFSILIQHANLDVNSGMVIKAKSLKEIKKQAKIYEEIGELRAMIPNNLHSNNSNIIYKLLPE